MHVSRLSVTAWKASVGGREDASRPELRINPPTCWERVTDDDELQDDHEREKPGREKLIPPH